MCGNLFLFLGVFYSFTMPFLRHLY